MCTFYVICVNLTTNNQRPIGNHEWSQIWCKNYQPSHSVLKSSKVIQMSIEPWTRTIISIMD